MKEPFFSSLIFKVGLVIIVIEIVVLTSTGIYYTRQFNEAVDARVYSRVAIPGQLMTKGMLEYEVVRDRVEMTDLAGDDLVEAMVIAVTGKVFYSFHTEYEGRDASQVPGLSSEWFSPSVTESFIREETDGGNRYVVSVTPILAGETRKPYYFFYLKVSTNQAAQEKQDIAGLFLTGAIACVFLTSLAILLIFRIMISKRLSMALDGIKRFESGDLDARIELVKSNDEIAILQHGINSMASKLQEIIANLKTEVAERVQAEEALKEYAERLEEMVEERTARLQQSEEKSRAQYKGIPVPTYTWQKVEEGIVLVDYNDAAEAVTQGEIADFVGIELGEMYRDTPEIREDILRCLAEKNTIEREMRYRFQSTGEERHLAVKYAFVPPDLVLVHTEDITERVQAEEELRKHAAEQKRMVNLMAGREVRMAELKGVIRKLRAQLEEAGLEPAANDPLLAGDS